MFLMPFILTAGLLGLIPVLVHLLNRQQVTPIAWGAMQFLMETPLKVRRKRRIDNWLLMLIRMAILLLVVLLLARPVIKDARLIGSTPIDVAIVLDHSLSMGQRVASAAGGGNQPLGANPSAGTLFDEGLRTAERLARMLPNGGTVSIVLAEHAPRIITSTPIKMGLSELDSNGEARGEWGRILQILHQMRPGMTKANIPAAVGVARELLSHSFNTRKMILVLSDDQRSNWAPGSEAQWNLASGGLPPGAGTPDPNAPTNGSIRVFDYPLTSALAPNAANVSIRAVSVAPAFIGIHRPATITAAVTNAGASNLTNIPIQLLVDGRMITTQTLPSLAAGGTENVRFDHYFAEAGSHWLQVHADVIDALDADNTATAAVQVNPKLPVLIIDGQLTGTTFPKAAYLAAAMQPLDPTIDPTTLIAPTTVSVAQIGARIGAVNNAVRIEDFPIVVLNDVPRLPREAVERLAEHAQHGNGVWIILGPRTEEEFLKDILGKSTLAPLAGAKLAHAPLEKPEAGTTQPAARQAPISLDIKQPTNPAVAMLILSEQNALSGATLRTWWSVIPGSPQMQTIIATTTPPEGAQGTATAPAAGPDPFILELEQGKAGGRVIVWTSAVSAIDWNNLPWIPNFTPLVNETLFHLASGQSTGQPRQLDVGAPLYWTGPATTPIQSAILEPPEGIARTLQPQLRGDSYFLGDSETYMPGLYTLRFVAPVTAGAKAPAPVFYSVNIDPDELRSDLLAPAEVDWLKHQGHIEDVLTAETLPKALDAQQGGMEIWWLLGLLLFAFLVLEVFMTRNLARQQGGSTLVESGLDGALPASATAGASR